MRIPPWTAESALRDPALVAAIMARRGGKLLNLDRALLWSAPLARGWNGFLRAVRQEFSVSPQLKELAICVVAKSPRSVASRPPICVELSARSCVVDSAPNWVASNEETLVLESAPS